MRILTGDECGLLKETIPEQCRPHALNSNHIKNPLSTLDGVRRVDPNEPQRRARGVIDMSFTTSDKSSFAALRANKSIQLWESTRDVPKESFGSYQCTGVVSNVFDESDDNCQQGRPMALDSLKEQRLCAADSLGTIAVVTTQATPSVVATYSPFDKQQQQQQTLSYTKGSYANTSICTAMAVDQYHGRVAVSGRERETRLMELHTGKVVWKAKNLPPDPQTLLQQPIWSTALKFVNNESVMAVGTAFSQVRLYDVRSSRRPVAYTPEHDNGALHHRITALCPVEEHELVVGDAAGYLHVLDMRCMGKRQENHLKVTRLVGPVGSVRQVVKHAFLPMICTVGLDRMLRTYCLERKRLVDCVYMKQRLNCALFCQDDTWNVQEQQEHTVVEDYQGKNDVDADDEVQDYIDSSGDERDDDDDDDDSDEQSEDNDNDDSQEDDSQDESDDDDSDASDSEEEEEVTRRLDFKRQKRV